MLQSSNVINSVIKDLEKVKQKNNFGSVMVARQNKLNQLCNSNFKLIKLFNNSKHSSKF